jgi:hypothetical protein
VTVAGSAGSAVLTDSGVVTTLGGVNVNGNGFLAGAGIVNAAVTVASGGTLEPSASAAGLTVNTGPVKLETGSTFQLSLANSNAGTGGAPALSDYSKLTLGTGVSATLGGTIVADLTGPVKAMDLFTIILSGVSVTGTFANTTPVSGSTYAFMSGGVSYEINYAFNSSAYTGTQASFQADTGGRNVAVLVLAVPEPNSWSMLLGSIGLALGLQRFRRRRI